MRLSLAVGNSSKNSVIWCIIQHPTREQENRTSRMGSFSFFSLFITLSFYLSVSVYFCLYLLSQLADVGRGYTYLKSIGQAGTRAGSDTAVYRQNSFPARATSVLPLEPFNWLNQAQPGYGGWSPLLKSTDCGCESYLQNTLIATPGFVFDWITGYSSLSRLILNMDHQGWGFFLIFVTFLCYLYSYLIFFIKVTRFLLILASS